MKRPDVSAPCAAGRALHLAIASALPVCYQPGVHPRASSSAAGLGRLFRAGAAALSLTAILAAPLGDAEAQGGGSSAASAPAPVAAPGDGAAAQQIIKDVEAKAKEPRTAKVVVEPLLKAKKAMERAHGARMAGDALHARVLYGLALEWAETARELLRAASGEEEALVKAREARDLGVQLERARALLEEAQARRGRAAADLTRAEAEAKEAGKRAAEAEEERVAKGRKKDKGADAKGSPKGAKPGGGDAKKPPAGAGTKSSPKGAK
jgi:hypothetical protein